MKNDMTLNFFSNHLPPYVSSFSFYNTCAICYTTNRCNRQYMTHITKLCLNACIAKGMLFRPSELHKYVDASLFWWRRDGANRGSATVFLCGNCIHFVFSAEICVNVKCRLCIGSDDVPMREQDSGGDWEETDRTDITRGREVYPSWLWLLPWSQQTDE